MAGTKSSSTQGRAWRTVRIIVGPHEDYNIQQIVAWCLVAVALVVVAECPHGTLSLKGGGGRVCPCGGVVALTANADVCKLGGWHLGVED